MIDFFLVWEAENFTMIGLQRRRAQRQRGDIFWWQDNNWFHCVQLRGPAQLSHYDKTLTVLKTDLPKLNSKTLERFRLSIWASSYQNWHDVSTVLDGKNCGPRITRYGWNWWNFTEKCKLKSNYHGQVSLREALRTANIASTNHGSL